MEYVAIAVSVLAMAISGLAFWQTKRQADAAVRDVTLAEQQHEAKQIASQSALVTAFTTGGDERLLVIRNSGMATAREVDLVVEAPIGSPGDAPLMDLERFPCDLAPDSQVTVTMLVTFGSADRLQVSVVWGDDLGSHEFKGVLPVP